MNALGPSCKYCGDTETLRRGRVRERESYRIYISFATQWQQKQLHSDHNTLTRQTIRARAAHA